MKQQHAMVMEFAQPPIFVLVILVLPEMDVPFVRPDTMHIPLVHCVLMLPPAMVTVYVHPLLVVPSPPPFVHVARVLAVISARVVPRDTLDIPLAFPPLHHVVPPLLAMVMVHVHPLEHVLVIPDLVVTNVRFVPLVLLVILRVYHPLLPLVLPPPLAMVTVCVPTRDVPVALVTLVMDVPHVPPVTQATQPV
jgi:hypothetical protein